MLLWYTLLICLVTYVQSQTLSPNEALTANDSSPTEEVAKAPEPEEDLTVEATTPCPEKLSPKTLLEVQKDSLLLKLVGAKRQKRQVNYSSYYPAQTGVEAHYDTKPSSKKAPTAQKPTYRRQAAPNYHLKQPVKGYRNPSLYMRPTKGSHYKASGNRRQFQGRYSSTTARSTRAGIKKKFRPSPVFA